MRLHGINRDAFDRYVSIKPSWYYEVVAPGFKYNLTDIASSIGLVQLTKADKFHQKRTKMALRYIEELKELPLLIPHAKNTYNHSWHLFVINLQDKLFLKRDEFIQKMSDLRVGTSVHFIPLHMQPYWKNEYKLKMEDFPVANSYYKTAVSLPVYTKMTDDDQTKVILAIKDVCQKII